MSDPTSTRPPLDQYAREQLETALSGLASGAADVDVLGPAELGLMALHLLYGRTSPVILDVMDVLDELELPELICICPPEVVDRGGFRAGCPIHHVTGRS